MIQDWEAADRGARTEIRQCEIILEHAEEAVRLAGEELRRAIRQQASAERSLRDAMARAERDARRKRLTSEGAQVTGRTSEWIPAE